MALDVETGGGIGFGEIERAESVVDVVIEGNGSLGGAGFGKHQGGAVTECGVGMHLLHKFGEIASGVILVDGLIEGDEGVFNRARSFGGEQRVDGTLAGGEAVGLYFFEGGNVRFAGPDGGLRNGDFLSGEHGSENERETEKDSQAYREHHERTSSRKFWTGEMN